MRAANWPIGDGSGFTGLYDHPSGRVLTFERTAHGQHKALETVARLWSEYGVKTSVERLPFPCARWVTGPPDRLARLYWPTGSLRLRDRAGRLIVLFATERSLDHFVADHPELECHAMV